MKRILILIPLLFAILLLAGCEKPPSAPDASVASQELQSNEAELVAREFIAQSGWQLDPSVATSSSVSLSKSGGGNSVMSFVRQPIARGVVHYKIKVRVGSGPYNFIGIHRVVKETRPGVPLRTNEVLFYQHGDLKDFEGMVLPGVKGTTRPIDFGMAIYLAENNVDVWGIDQAWNFVPETETNFGFMRTWGLKKQMDDLNLAIGVARTTRLLTGCGTKKVTLSGYSSGVVTTVALLNEETKLPIGRRHVDAYIPVDLPIICPPGPFRDAYMADAAIRRNEYDAGTYQFVTGFPMIGRLAQTDPSGASPIFAGFTNLEVALFFGAGQIFGESTFHFLAGILDPTGSPTGFQFLTMSQWYEFAETAAPYQSNLHIAEYEELSSGIFTLPYYDHLAEIRVPVFNVAAKGGCGELTLDGLTLLGSTDKTSLIVETPNPSVLVEYGHVDLFTSPNAPTKVWQPILNWMRTH